MKKSILFIFCLLASLLPFEILGQPTMNDFIGVNMRAKDAYPQGFSQFGILREYHEWASDIGYDDNSLINCPWNNPDNPRKLTLNPSLDPSTLLNFDNFYATYPAAYPNLKGLAPEMRGLQAYGSGEILEQKPFCTGLEGLAGYGFGDQANFTLVPISKEETEFSQTQNGFFDGIVNAEVTTNNTYTGTVTIQKNALYSDYHYGIKIWIDFDMDGHFNNSFITDDGTGFPTLGQGESIEITGASQVDFMQNGVSYSDYMLVLKDNDFSTSNETTVNFQFSVPSGINPGLLKMRIGMNSYTNQDVSYIPLHWELPNPGGGNGDMWDIGLLYCGSNMKLPNNSPLYSFSDEKVKITNLTLNDDNNTELVNKSVPYQDAVEEHNDFFDPSSVLHLDSEYSIEVSSDQDDAANTYFGLWILNNSEEFETIISPTPINNSPFAVQFNSQDYPSGMYRLRMAVGDMNIGWDGGFDGELRDFLVILGKNVECYQLKSIETKNPTNPINSGALMIKLAIGLSVNQNTPMAYFDFARWASMITARYGSVDFYDSGNSEVKGTIKTLFRDEELMTDDGASAFGQNKIKFLELGNEMDKFWRGDKSLLNSGNNLYQMIPDQFEAFLSASYDGGCKDDMFEIGSSGQYYGAKNIDPNIQVALGGMAGMQGGFLENVMDFAQANRSSCERILPFDVINLHHYCTTLNRFGETSSILGDDGTHLSNFEATYQLWDWNGFGEGHGVSPEEGGLRQYVEGTLEGIMNHAFDLNMSIFSELADCDVWISEFGYDSSLGDLEAKSNTSWVAVPEIGDNSLQETHAQWSVRSFLELSSVKAVAHDRKMIVDRAMIFDYRDDWIHPNTPTYNESGLLRDGDIHNSEPKKAWFHVQTMRNVLGETVYQGEFTEHQMTPQSGTFDFSDKARIYHYQGRYKGADADILAIWSPNSSDSEWVLALNFSDNAIQDELLNNNLNVSSITLIIPRDGDEDGFHVSQSVSGNSYTFTGDYAITETPMYVVLNVSEDEAVHAHCPEFTVEDLGCSSLTLRWSPIEDEPLTTDIYVMEGSHTELDIETESTRLATRDFKYDIRKHGVGALQPNTQYAIFLLMKWPDGSIHTCSHTVTTPELGRCHIAYWDGSGNAPDGLYFTASVINTNDDGLDAFQEHSTISCTNYDEALTGDNMWDYIWDWPGQSSIEIYPTMIIEFSEDIILNSMDFLHATGNGYLRVEFQICDCDEEWFHASTFAPNGYMNWVYLSEGFPANLAIQKIRLTRGTFGPDDNMTLARLGFCGEETGCPSGPVHPPIDKNWLTAEVSLDFDNGNGNIDISPVPNIPGEPGSGFKKRYTLFYQEVNGAEIDFSNAQTKEAYLIDGAKTVTFKLTDLAPDTEYKAYWFTYDPCDKWSWGRRHPIIPPVGTPSLGYTGYVDNIFYFDTYTEKRNNNEDKGTNYFIHVDPNPTTGWVDVRWNRTGYSALVIMNGNTGEIVAKHRILSVETNQKFDLTHLAPGQYYIRLEGTAQEPILGKFVKTTE